MDGVMIEEFEEKLEENLVKLHQELKEKLYRPMPVKRQLIPKSGQGWARRKVSATGNLDCLQIHI